MADVGSRSRQWRALALKSLALSISAILLICVLDSATSSTLSQISLPANTAPFKNQDSNFYHQAEYRFGHRSFRRILIEDPRVRPAPRSYPPPRGNVANYPNDVKDPPPSKPSPPIHP
ncbi:uncharacterized protein [Physcomitrium patens]|uniref:Uncharacterized protein n=1 Tax=Physcomitrium patens TaxID=3218 RepID=A9RML8_PHYPA|nr:uncharacterized protein LOC112295023 [Physcomitrium patens]PNR34775.1 hypothetical protein PHYPA_022673 [Physcomitrium patens]|eukprot:XP_024401890.1 uncharacterized protein LOC112295023 [Physcomitrella patens]